MQVWLKEKNAKKFYKFESIKKTFTVVKLVFSFFKKEFLF